MMWLFSLFPKDKITQQWGSLSFNQVKLIQTTFYFSKDFSYRLYVFKKKSFFTPIVLKFPECFSSHLIGKISFGIYEAYALPILSKSLTSDWLHSQLVSFNMCYTKLNFRAHVTKIWLHTIKSVWSWCSNLNSTDTCTQLDKDFFREICLQIRDLCFIFTNFANALGTNPNKAVMNNVFSTGLSVGIRCASCWFPKDSKRIKFLYFHLSLIYEQNWKGQGMCKNKKCHLKGNTQMLFKSVILNHYYWKADNSSKCCLKYMFWDLICTECMSRVIF